MGKDLGKRPKSMALIAGFALIAVTLAVLRFGWFPEVRGSIDLGDLIVGLGTLALAGVTWWMARSTNAQSKIAQRAIDAASEPCILPASIKPSLGIQVLRGRSEHQLLKGSPSTAILDLLNAGTGPGILDEFAFKVDGKNIALPFLRKSVFGVGHEMKCALDFDYDAFEQRGADDGLEIWIDQRALDGSRLRVAIEVNAVDGGSRLDIVDVSRQSL